MTNHEAIQFLDNMKHEEAGRAIGKDGFYAELMGYHVQALNVAIKALSRSENPNKWMAADVLNHWIGAEVLDKIRTEIADIYCGQYCENPPTADSVREMALDIIDKYKAEGSEE